MKIATFNINNVNRRLPNLLRWLRAAKPDVVCLQELKSTDAEFPIAAIEKAGYGAVWRGQKTWNGVAILARNAEPVLTRTALPGDRDDDDVVLTPLNLCAETLDGVRNHWWSRPTPGTPEGEVVAWADRIAYCATTSKMRSPPASCPPTMFPAPWATVAGRERRRSSARFMAAMVEATAEAGRVGCGKLRGRCTRSVPRASTTSASTCARPPGPSER